MVYEAFIFVLIGLAFLIAYSFEKDSMLKILWLGVGISFMLGTFFFDYNLCNTSTSTNMINGTVTTIYTYCTPINLNNIGYAFGTIIVALIILFFYRVLLALIAGL